MVICSLFIALYSCKNDSSNANVTPNAETAELAKSSVNQTAVATPVQIVENHTTGDLSWLGMGDVEAKVKSSKRKVIVDVYTDWCGPCKMMDARTFVDPAVQKVLNDKFYPVKFNAEGPNSITFQGKNWDNAGHDPNKKGRNSQHQLASFFQVPGYPTLVVLDENFNILKKIVGFKTPEQLLVELESI